MPSSQKKPIPKNILEELGCRPQDFLSHYSSKNLQAVLVDVNNKNTMHMVKRHYDYVARLLFSSSVRAHDLRRKGVQINEVKNCRNISTSFINDAISIIERHLNACRALFEQAGIEPNLQKLDTCHFIHLPVTSELMLNYIELITKFDEFSSLNASLAGRGILDKRTAVSNKRECHAAFLGLNTQLNKQFHFIWHLKLNVQNPKTFNPVAYHQEKVATYA